MAKMGRPKGDNSKEYQLAIRFSRKEQAEIEKYAAENNITVTETVRKGVSEFLKSRQ